MAEGLPCEQPFRDTGFGSWAGRTVFDDLYLFLPSQFLVVYVCVSIAPAIQGFGNAYVFALNLHLKFTKAIVNNIVLEYGKSVVKTLYETAALFLHLVMNFIYRYS